MKKGILGCEEVVRKIPLSKILPRHQSSTKAKKSRKYATIKKSIENSGLVEPLVVQKLNGSYLILDGHWRFYVMQELNSQYIDCYIAKSDESFSYNHFVNRLSPFQEHAMIKKAIEQGVSEVEIANALNIQVKRVKTKVNLTKGLHPEVISLLENVKIPMKSVDYLKSVVPERQIAMAQLMHSANNFTQPYAKALLDSTDEKYLVRKIKKHSTQDLNKLRMEHQKLEKQFQAAEEHYAKTIFNLTLSITYIRKLLDNSKVVSYLSKHHHDIFLEFERLASQDSI